MWGVSDPLTRICNQHHLYWTKTNRLFKQILLPLGWEKPFGKRCDFERHHLITLSSLSSWSSRKLGCSMVSWKLRSRVVCDLVRPPNLNCLAISCTKHDSFVLFILSDTCLWPIRLCGPQLQRASRESNQPLTPPVPSHHHPRKIRSLQATDKCALHAASLSLTAEHDCRLSRAAGWLEGQLVPSCPALWLEFSSGPPLPSRATAHNLVSASLLHEPASRRLETSCGRNKKLWGWWWSKTVK